MSGARAVNCPECGGSGMRSCNGREFECFDCSGEGQWEEEDRLTESVERDLRFTMDLLAERGEERAAA